MLDLAESIVKYALSLGAQDVVAEAHVLRNYQVRFSRNQIDIGNAWREEAASLFVVYDKRVVATEIKNLSKFREAVERVIRLAKASQPNPQYRGIALGPFKYAPLRVDKKILNLDDGTDFVNAAVNAALARGAKESAGSFWRFDEEHWLSTSNRVEATDRHAGLYLSIRSLVSPESSGHGVECATRYSQFDPERAGERAGEIASLARNPVQGDPGKYDVLFAPMILGSMVSEIGRHNSAYNVQAGLSALAKKIGKKVASENVTLIDDATREGLGHRRFDDEGVPTRRTIFVKAGQLRTHFHNASTARFFKAKNTGNAGLVAPSANQLILEPGDYGLEELMEEVKDGLYLTNTWYTRYQNYVTGDFSTIPRDGIFLLRKGEIAGVWKGIRLSDNLLNLWRSIEAIGKESHQVMWWEEVSPPSFVPYAVARKIRITTSAQ